jgi:hypothetical protein
MATTVFPQTDDTATVAGWAAMIAALDRGQADPLSGSNDVTNDSTNLVWSGSSSGIALTTTGYQTFATLPVDQGTVWAGEVNIEIQRVNNGGSASDNIAYAITVPAGITAYAYVVCPGQLGTANGRIDGNAYTAVTDTQITFTTAAIPDWDFVVRYYLVLIGDTASGDVLIRLEKQTDADVDNWNIFGRAMLTRIKG